MSNSLNRTFRLVPLSERRGGAILILTLLVVGVALVSFSPGQAGAQDRDALKADIVAGWKRLAQIDDETKTCRVEYAFNSFGRSGSRLTGKLGIGDRMQLFSVKEPETGKQLVYASSQWYGFLIGNTNVAGQGWTLFTTYTPEQLNDPKIRGEYEHPLRARAQCFRPLSRFGLGGDGFARWAEFYPLTIDKVEPGDGDLLTISYSLKDVKATQVTERGRMVLDKAASYCPVEISRRRTLQPELLLEEKRTLASKQPTRCASWTARVTRGTTVEEESSFTFSDYSDRPPPEEELTLSHYGLPEPVGMALPPKRTPRYVWFLIGAAAFGLLAGGLRYFARRRRTPVERGENS